MAAPLRPQHLRQLIAQLAARMMADEGAQDYAYAKRKAARQLGANDDRCLPTNSEIEHELKLHHALFRREEQPQHLHQLRSEALAMMQQLARFNPHLTGSVLDGTAGRYADIDIHLFVDSLKDVELFLLNHAIPYQMEERSWRVGQDKLRLPVFALDGRHGTIHLYIFDTDDLRFSSKGSGATPTRATIPALTALLNEPVPAHP